MLDVSGTKVIVPAMFHLHTLPDTEVHPTHDDILQLIPLHARGRQNKPSTVTPAVQWSTDVLQEAIQTDIVTTRA